MRNPQQLRACVVVTDDITAARVRRLVERCGSVRAAVAILGIGEQTFAAARDRGRMMRTTRDRLLAALERAEAVS